MKKRPKKLLTGCVKLSGLSTIRCVPKRPTSPGPNVIVKNNEERPGHQPRALRKACLKIPNRRSLNLFRATAPIGPPWRRVRPYTNLPPFQSSNHPLRQPAAGMFPDRSRNSPGLPNISLPMQRLLQPPAAALSAQSSLPDTDNLHPIHQSREASDARQPGCRVLHDRSFATPRMLNTLHS
jgi:hypothetical protein